MEIDPKKTDKKNIITFNYYLLDLVSINRYFKYPIDNLTFLYKNLVKYLYVTLYVTCNIKIKKK